MKVYLVFKGYAYEGEYLVGVYSTLELAKVKFEAINSTSIHNYRVLMECGVDEPEENWKTLEE